MCKLALFGPPALECGGRPRHIARRKALALLAYLALSAQSHSRESLVALLWPDYDQREGRADLSRMLSTLRKALGETALAADRERVALDASAGLWVDAAHFRQEVRACREAVAAGKAGDYHDRMARAAALYQAGFLAGFTLPGCPAFDEWQLLQTEALRRDFGWLLAQLVAACEARADLPQAVDYARRWVELDPLHEPAQRRLIALYARSGQRAAALRQVQACARVLAAELGVEPEPATKQLYEQIRSSGGTLPLAAARSPAFAWTEPDAGPAHPFVGRDRELARLDDLLAGAIAGRGRVVFLTGGAGWGKTSLLHAFIRRALDRHARLVVAGGSGSAFAGAGDPYLPFREVLGQLAGDLLAPPAAGAMSREQARRLWELAPETAQALVDHGPQLLGLFVSGKQLLARVAGAAPAGAPWLLALQQEVARQHETPGQVEQAALFGQLTTVLHHLAQQRPLLITLDDLQWLDDASVALLFHLGHRLAGSPILIAGAFRPDELAQGHPLQHVLDEFQRLAGDIFVDLARPTANEGRAFVGALLDAEPNRLDGAFRQALFRQTRGHPLFTVELLRDLQKRGYLVLDEAGRWSESAALDWQSLPARVEAVIARRLGRLDSAARDILSVASVEGEEFTAEVVARVLGLPERPLLRDLSSLQQRDRLVAESGEVPVGRGYLSAFRFRHRLFQQYLYRQLPAGERRRLHAEVANALASLYAGDLDQIVVSLAHHYAAAAAWDQAVPHWIRAGDLAYQKASLRDAAGHYQSALAHWPEAGGAGRAATLRKLGECLWMLGQHEEALAQLATSYDLFHAAGDTQGAAAVRRLSGRVHWERGEAGAAGRAFQHALALADGEPEGEELAWALAGMAGYHMHLGDYETSIELGERALAQARRLGIDALVVQCLCDLGSALSGRGDWAGLALERESLSLALALNRPHDAGRAYLYLAEGLAYLGRYQEARETLAESLAHSRRLHLPYLTAGATRQLAHLDWLTGRWPAALAGLDEITRTLHNRQPAGLLAPYLAITRAQIDTDLGQAGKAYGDLVATGAGPPDSLDPGVAFLGAKARAALISGRTAAGVAAAAEILEWTDQASHLYPNIGMALLFICQAPLVAGDPAVAGHAHSAWQQLQRLDRQYRTPLTAACRLEGQGWYRLAGSAPAAAVPPFAEAVAIWETVGHPYDQARALSGLSQARLADGDSPGSRAAAQQAMGLVDALAGQLDEPALQASFLQSALVTGIRDGLQP
jgi:DNA-binding SARP family transcriptional activator/tetratricopeptide (TPR) repeat protein